MPRLIALVLALVLALPALAASPVPAAAGQAVGADEFGSVAEGIAAVDDPAVVAARAARFPNFLDAHVDRFWAREFARSGRGYDSPGGVVGLAEPTMTACGPADPLTEAAFYCLLDETIYYSVVFRQSVESNVGDFGWIVVVAHEWAHHVQREIGIDLLASPDRAGSTTSRELEQQADCLAGAYAEWAEADGWLDPGDVEEALFVTGASGDPQGTAWNAPGAHGTGADRVGAFAAGYRGGVPGCGLEL